MTHLELEECFRAHKKTLIEKAYFIVRDWDLAEDVVQDTFMKLLSTEADYNPDLSAPQTWLVNIVGRQALNAKRDREAAAVRAGDYSTLLQGHEDRTPSTEGEREAEEADLLQNVRKELVKEWLVTDRTLSASARKGIQRVYFDGWPVSKAAEEQGVHPWILHRRLDTTFTKWRKWLKRLEASGGTG